MTGVVLRFRSLTDDIKGKDDGKINANTNGLSFLTGGPAQAVFTKNAGTPGTVETSSGTLSLDTVAKLRLLGDPASDNDAFGLVDGNKLYYVGNDAGNFEAGDTKTITVSEVAPGDVTLLSSDFLGSIGNDASGDATDRYPHLYLG